MYVSSKGAYRQRHAAQSVSVCIPVIVQRPDDDLYLRPKLVVT